jgi:hypothetical protein
VESTSSSTISGKTISRVSSNFFKEKKSRPPRERDGRHTAPLQGRAHYHVCGVGQTPSIQVQTICPALVRKTPPAGTPQGKGSGCGAARRWCVTHRVPPRPSNVTWSQAIIIAPYRFCRLQLFSSRHEGKMYHSETARQRCRSSSFACREHWRRNQHRLCAVAVRSEPSCVLSVLAQLRTASE